MAKHSLKKVTPSSPTNEAPNTHVDEEAANKKADELDATFEGVDTSKAESMEDSVQTVLDKNHEDEHEQPTATVPQRYQAQPPALSVESGGQLQGGFDRSDIKMPLIKVVQGSSTLKEEFREGDVVFGENLLLESPPTKGGEPQQFRFIPFMLKKQYRQNLTQEEIDDGEMPAIVDTLDEVHALGGTTQWMGKTKPSWGPLGTVSMLIEQPEGNEDPQFSLEFDGNNFAVAQYIAGGSAYTHCPKVILNNALTMLLEPMMDPQSGKPLLTPSGQPRKRPVLYRAFWTFHVTRVRVRDFLIFQPRVKLLQNELASKDIRGYCEGLLSRA